VFSVAVYVVTSSNGMKMSHVMLGASSLDKLVPFYSEVLGLKVVGQAEGEFVFFDTGGTVQLTLRELHGTADPGDTEIVFEVQDIHKCYDDLKQKGVSFRVAPRVISGTEARDFYAADFRDPDGHVLSITGWVSKVESPSK
jgi:catechol 2,3-dioxygenase-like lactoylglutathione lyase family enzyme